MTTFYDAVYLWGILLIVPIWIWVFYKSDKSSRKDIFYSGILYGLAALLIAKGYALADYWNPPYVFPPINFEDFLYGFFYGGIISEFFERLFGYKSIKGKKRYNRHTTFFAITVVVAILSFVILVDWFGLNSIIAHIAPLAFVLLGIMVLRKDLLMFALKSGVFITIFTLVWFKIILLIRSTAVVEFWKLENLSGTLLLGIPIEEYLFAFMLGAVASVFYELILGESIVKKH